MKTCGATFHFIQRLRERYSIPISPKTWLTISHEIARGKHYHLITDTNITWYYLKIGNRWVYAGYRSGVGLITTLTQTQFRTTYGTPSSRTYQLPDHYRRPTFQELIDTCPTPQGWKVANGYGFKKASRQTKKRYVG